MPRQMLVRHVHVAETDAAARAEAEPYMLEGLIGLDGVKRAKSIRPEEATPQMLETARVYLKTAESYDFWIEEGLGFVGSPDTVARQIAAQQQRVGYDILLAQHNIGNMPHALAHNSIRLFGERVIPAFRAEAARRSPERYQSRARGALLRRVVIGVPGIAHRIDVAAFGAGAVPRVAVIFAHRRFPMI